MYNKKSAEIFGQPEALWSINQNQTDHLQLCVSVCFFAFSSAHCGFERALKLSQCVRLWILSLPIPVSLHCYEKHLLIVTHTRTRTQAKPYIAHIQQNTQNRYTIKIRMYFVLFSSEMFSCHFLCEHFYFNGELCICVQYYYYDQRAFQWVLFQFRKF